MIVKFELIFETKEEFNDLTLEEVAELRQNIVYRLNGYHIDPKEFFVKGNGESTIQLISYEKQ